MGVDYDACCVVGVPLTGVLERRSVKKLADRFDTLTGKPIQVPVTEHVWYVNGEPATPEITALIEADPDMFSALFQTLSVTLQVLQPSSEGDQSDCILGLLLGGFAFPGRARAIGNDVDVAALFSEVARQLRLLGSTLTPELYVLCRVG